VAGVLREQGKVRSKEKEQTLENGVEEMWKIALPGDFVGATRLNSLWHLYYREKPPFSSGDTFEISFELPAKDRPNGSCSHTDQNPRVDLPNLRFEPWPACLYFPSAGLLVDPTLSDGSPFEVLDCIRYVASSTVDMDGS
jgi:hypothetical protein